MRVREVEVEDGWQIEQIVLQMLQRRLQAFFSLLSDDMKNILIHSKPHPSKMYSCSLRELQVFDLI